MVMVSINCITYNHEKYIAQAIEGFLSQRTNFEVEILIHDDASTDRTADIIREYVQKYPEKFNVIYQTENQYSKGVFIGRLNEERARGKYIAVCAAIPQSSVEQLDLADLNGLAWILIGFFMTPASTPPTA